MPPKVRRPAAAKAAVAKPPPRPGRRAVRRRPAAEERPAPEEGSNPKNSFDKGEFLEAHLVPLGWLAEKQEVIAEGLYRGIPCKVAGRVKSLVVRGEGDVELLLSGEGTDNEDLLTWMSQGTGEPLRLHLCGSQCKRGVEGHGFIHVQRIRRKLESDKGGWSENMKGGEDELRRLREWGQEDKDQERPKRRKSKEKNEEASTEEDSSGKKKKKKKKEKKAGKDKDTGKKEKKKESKEKEKVGPQKSLKACFQGTGVDPDPKARASLRRRVKKKMKKKKEGSSSDGGGSSTGSSSSSSGEAQDEEVFQDEHRVRTVARLGPGLLTTATIKAMQEQLLTEQGTMWSQEASEVPPICLQYFRGNLQKKLAGGAMREALNLCWSLDLLLRGRVAEATDTLCQRVKSLELVANGAAWAVAQRVELPPPEKGGLSSRAETSLAVKENQAELKARNQSKGGPKGKSEGSFSTWKGGGKGEQKGKEKGKGKKGEKEEQRKNS